MSFSAYRLSSPELEVVIVPQQGGRIASIKSVRSGMEFLTQAHREVGTTFANLKARFQDGPCAGYEECLPTVGPSGSRTVGGAVPDHGDFWQLPWTVAHADECSLTQAALGFSRPLRFQKSARLHRNQLRLEYSIQNVGTVPVSFLYAAHPLFAVDPGDEIFLPTEVDSLRLDYSRGERIGRKGDVISWPVTGQGVPLNRAGAKVDGTAEMFYTGRLTAGRARISRTRSGQSLEISFDAGVLPYMGIWLCYGGWPDDASEQLQYAVALEPTTSPHNTLELAQLDGTAVELEPGQAFHFAVTISVFDPQP